VRGGAKLLRRIGLGLVTIAQEEWRGTDTGRGKKKLPWCGKEVTKKR